MAVRDYEAFGERVRLAADYIANNRTKTRTFDTCFEMHDGELVAVALWRRMQADLAGKLARNFKEQWTDKGVEQWRASAEKFAHVPTRKLAAEARKMREQSRREFDEFMERVEKERAA